MQRAETLWLHSALYIQLKHQGEDSDSYTSVWGPQVQVSWGRPYTHQACTVYKLPLSRPTVSLWLSSLSLSGCLTESSLRQTRFVGHDSKPLKVAKTLAGASKLRFDYHYMDWGINCWDGIKFDPFFKHIYLFAMIGHKVLDCVLKQEQSWFLLKQLLGSENTVRTRKQLWVAGCRELYLQRIFFICKEV